MSFTSHRPLCSKRTRHSIGTLMAITTENILNTDEGQFISFRRKKQKGSSYAGLVQHRERRRGNNGRDAAPVLNVDCAWNCAQAR
jgi:hypothetical protein